MQEMVAQLKLRTDSAKCKLISNLATDPVKRELFERIAKHLAVLADEVERAIAEQPTGADQSLYRRPDVLDRLSPQSDRLARGMPLLREALDGCGAPQATVLVMAPLGAFQAHVSLIPSGLWDAGGHWPSTQFGHFTKRVSVMIMRGSAAVPPGLETFGVRARFL